MLYIHGLGHFHPDNIIDNAFLESLNIETNDQWIMERVGIRERRTVLSLDYIRDTYNKNPSSIGSHLQYTNAETGERAARLALERAQLTPEQIGMVIAGSCSPQYALPAEACMIAARLEINAPSLDINSACSTFLAHLHMVNQLDTASSPDYILLVIPESTTRFIDYSDRRSAVLWGDATAAIIVSKKIPSRFKVNYTSLASRPAGWDKITLPSGGHFQQDGAAVQRFAIKQTVACISELQKKFPTQQQPIFIGHQANLTMLQSACKMLDISESHHWYNIDRFGNCGAAGAPCVLSQNCDRLKAGDTVFLAVVGSGLTWGNMMLECE